TAPATPTTTTIASAANTDVRRPRCEIDGWEMTSVLIRESSSVLEPTVELTSNHRGGRFPLASRWIPAHSRVRHRAQRDVRNPSSPGVDDVAGDANRLPRSP